MTTFIIGTLCGFCACAWLWRITDTTTTTHNTPPPVATLLPPAEAAHVAVHDDRLARNTQWCYLSDGVDVERLN